MKNGTEAALNQLCKWRLVFASWQLGSRPTTDGECQAVRDHREATLVHRVELSALAGLLIDKGVISTREFEGAIQQEAAALERDLEEKFPGFKAGPNGMTIDTAVARETSREWPP